MKFAPFVDVREREGNIFDRNLTCDGGRERTNEMIIVLGRTLPSWRASGSLRREGLGRAHLPFFPLLPPRHHWHRIRPPRPSVFLPSPESGDRPLLLNETRWCRIRAQSKEKIRRLGCVNLLPRPVAAMTQPALPTFQLRRSSGRKVLLKEPSQ